MLLLDIVEKEAAQHLGYLSTIDNMVLIKCEKGEEGYLVRYQKESFQ